MKTLRLISKSIRGIGTFGELYDGSEVVCVTVEPDWQNNEKNVSCVPAGVYSVTRHSSPRFGDCFAISNKNLGVTVSGPSLRSNCLFHAANYPNELEGCIAPGLTFMPGSSRWGVSSSRKALDKLKERYPEGFVMEIQRL
ncbi:MULTISPECIES: DUF5675 family protein [unclassified Vibrio]|uniref:DUF5675 family protein n=1 Tax=unclassified Vibrio TaxID=2614977 RepID=UPI001360DAB2|nr:MULTISPECIES: DUF5675 family protein [unclassified Vibrio]NAW59664.1 hypothetical protein [Vibrio sp. V36_P2S2PM302]NAX26543.1 hypothetical protein [Vibrio sp. V38_P2S17PM301]NAX29062.1 hypothetical protein [Vibrio sp. V37_P2S8PM304]